MAGKRQHYLPRFLQRGFLADSSDPGERTWLHRRDSEPKLVGIRGVGVEDWFYSRRVTDSEATLDDVITALERDLHKDFARLRSSAPGTVVSGAMAAPLVAHLATRTAFIRSLTGQFMAQLADEVEARLGTVGGLRRVMGIDAAEPTAVLRTAIGDAIADLPLEQLGIPAPFIERLMLFIARERADEWLSESSGFVAKLTPILRADGSERLRDAHNRSLGTPPDETGWAKVLREFDWRIEAAEGAILPDCAVLVGEGAGDLVPFMMSNGEAARAVVMPLSSDRLLVGSKAGGAAVDLSELNRQAALASDSFFVGAAPEGADLVDLIGGRPSHAVRDVIEEAFAKLGDGAVSREGQPGERPTISSGLVSYQVICAGIGNEAFAQRVASVVNVIVTEMSRTLPLSDLDGVTFAADYANALQTLDRGSPDLAPVESEALAYGVATARCVEVERGGVRKDHIVFDGWIAAGLLSDDLEHQQLCALVIAKELAKVGHGALFAESFEIDIGVDLVRRALFPCVSQTPCAYFSSRESAGISPEHSGLYADLVVDSLAHARVAVQAARLSYRTSDDLGALLDVAFPCVRAVLGHVADWLGHRDGLAEGMIVAGSDLPERLRPFELEKWLDLFGRDLQALYATPDHGLDTARLFALARHAERLLWTLQICPWPIDEGVYYSVPFGDDLALLEAAQPT